MGLFQPATARILLLTGQGLRAFSWRNGLLLPDERFAADEAGLEEFGHYLSESPDIPLFLVVDVIEEDFRLENVVHVVGKDRKELHARKLAQFFRTTEYRAARVQGREKSGRRDDQVLFCALSNNEQISFWVHGILRQKAPLQGICSVSWLMELLAGFLKLGRVAHLLLVNLEEQSGLRQTYIQQGTLKFSRLSSLAAVRPGNLAKMIAAECTHTRQYLERLKLLPRDQTLEIHLAVQGEIGEEIEDGLPDSPLLRFHFHESGAVAGGLGIDPSLEDGQGIVFVTLMQALRSGGLVNIYGSESDLRFYRLRRVRHGLMAGVFLLSAGVLGHGLLLLTDGLKERAERYRLERETGQLTRRYQDILQNFPDTSVPAETMRQTVESAEMIQKQAVMPMEMMGAISRVMAVCQDIYLQKLGWKLSVRAGDENAAETGPDEIQLEAGEEGERAAELVPALLAGQTRLTALLEGTVHPPGGHLAVQQSVTRFMTALAQIPGVQVTPVAMPVETRSDSSMKAVLDGKAIDAGFSLQLVYVLPAVEAEK